jgi:hypothetical protein
MLTIEQVNNLLSDLFIVQIHSITEQGKLIINCNDGRKYLVSFDENNEIIWHDSKPDYWC